jgi:glycosyltransferase 2 family protein
MQKYRKRIFFGLILALTIYIILLVLLDSSGQFTDDVMVYFRSFPLWLIIPLSITQIAAGVFRFFIWNYYLGVVGARDKISLLDSAVIFVSGFTMVVSPGKAAELLKSVFLKMKTGVPITRSAPIVIAERVMDGISVIITLTLALLFAGESLALGDFLSLSRVIVFTSAGLIGFGLIVIQIAPLAYFFLNLTGEIPLVRRLQQPLTEFYESSREIFSLRHVIPMSLLGLGVYLSTTATLLITLQGFGFEITSALILQSLFTVGVTSAVGALSFVPNGAGVSEFTTYGVMTTIVMPFYPAMTTGMIAAVALISGFFHKWFRVLVGMGVALIFRNRLFTPGIETELAHLEEQHTRSQSINVAS